LTAPSPTLPPLPRRRLWSALLAVKRARLIGPLLPSLIESFDADRQMRLPSGTEISQLVIDETTRLSTELQPLTVERTTAVQLAVDSERQRLAGLESKGFAVAAFPLAVIATSAVLVGNNEWTTTFSFLAIVYAAFALVSAGRIVNPGPRASFVVSDARQADWLARLAATAEVNRSISISIQNRVYAALMDTVRGTLAAAIATSLLLINALS
jgi:hypothetical protein